MVNIVIAILTAKMVEGSGIMRKVIRKLKVTGMIVGIVNKECHAEPLGGVRRIRQRKLQLIPSS